MTDLLFLLRLPNFWELLSQPVSTFLEELYGNESDMSREFGDNEIVRDVIPDPNPGVQMMTGTPPEVGADFTHQADGCHTVDIDNSFGDVDENDANVFDNDFVDNQMVG